LQGVEEDRNSTPRLRLRLFHAPLRRHPISKE
jgi:hypothetical protein